MRTVRPRIIPDCLSNDSTPLRFRSSISFRSAMEPRHAKRCRNRSTWPRLAERLGFVRYWFAEHHGMASIASSVPEILIEHVAWRHRASAWGRAASCCRTMRRCEWPRRSTHSRRCIPIASIWVWGARLERITTSRALRPFDGELFPEQVKEMLALSRRSSPPTIPSHPCVSY